MLSIVNYHSTGGYSAEIERKSHMQNLLTLSLVAVKIEPSMMVVLILKNEQMIQILALLPSTIRQADSQTLNSISLIIILGATSLTPQCARD